MTLPLTAFLPVWGLLALNITSPGPNVLNTMATAIGSGRRAGVGAALGVGLGLGLWCLGMTLGIAALFRIWPTVRLVMTGVAIALLLSFAVKYLQNGLKQLRGGTQVALSGRGGMSMRRAFVQSLTINALNPKALTTWVAILSLFPTARAGAGDLALLGFVAILIGLTVHLAYATAFSTRHAARIYERAAPWINLAVAAFFTLFALRLGYGLFPDILRW